MKVFEKEITSVQLFCMIFFYVLSGLMLYRVSGVYYLLFICFIFICLCLAASLSRGAEGGAFAYALSILSLFINSLALARDVLAFSGRICLFYGGVSVYAVACAILFLCVFAVFRGMRVMARFAEVCVFSLACLIPLSLLGGGGGAFDMAWEPLAIFDAAAVVGSAPAVFSLYSRCVDKKSEMSCFAANSVFHPKALPCGIFAVISAVAVYAFLYAVGAKSVLSSFLVWFMMLSRIFTVCFSICDSTVLSAAEDKPALCRRVSCFGVLFASACFALGAYGTVAAYFCLGANIVYTVLLTAISYEAKRHAFAYGNRKGQGT